MPVGEIIYLVEKLEDQNRTNPIEIDNHLLQTAYTQIKKVIANGDYLKETVHLAHKIYGYIGDQGLEDRVSLLREYLTCSISNEERFWANWELVDNLALLRKNQEVIKEQSAFLDWTKANLELTYSTLRVMYDGTQAHCWVAEVREQEWLDIYYDLIEENIPTEANRDDRCEYVRTAGEILNDLKRFDESSKEAERLQRFNEEDPTWEEYLKYWVAVIGIQLDSLRMTEKWNQYDQVASRAVSEFNLMVQQHHINKSLDTEKLAHVAHEIGIRFLRANRYEEAYPLFQFAIDYDDAGVAHYFLAICIWMMQKDKEKTIYHLRAATKMLRGNGGLRNRYYLEMFLEDPDFDDVKDDKDFLEALTPDLFHE